MLLGFGTANICDPFKIYFFLFFPFQKRQLCWFCKLSCTYFACQYDTIFLYFDGVFFYVHPEAFPASLLHFHLLSDFQGVSFLQYSQL